MSELNMNLVSEVSVVLSKHTIECTGPGEVTCRACRDKSWMSWGQYRVHVAVILAPLIERQVREKVAGEIEDLKALVEGPESSIAEQHRSALGHGLWQAARIARGES